MYQKGFHTISRPRTVTLTLVFILLNALVWVVFSVITATNANPALLVPPLIKGIMASLSIAIAVMLLGLFIFINRRNRIAYYLAFVLLIATFLLNFFDDIGLVDLVVIIINIIPIILLIKDRDWYLQGKPQIGASV
jgi:lysylphosphatidylglycerol synthetase-like protein (DUF2156 family)